MDLQRYFRRGDSIPFARSDGRRWNLSASRYLPESLQLLPAFLGNPFLSFFDRIRLGRLLRKLTGPADRDEMKPLRFADWLTAQGAPESTIEFFWKPLVLSALSETLENVGCEAVRKVIADGFLAGREAMSVWIPTVPLREIYHDAVEKRLRENGVEIQMPGRVRRLHWTFEEDTGSDEDEGARPKVTAVEFADGRCRSFDACVLAVPAHRAWEILETSDLESYADQLGLDRFEPGAITTVHLWLNRRLLPVGQFHTALLGGPGQFLCCPKTENTTKIEGVYHTVVISASHRLLADGELTARGSGTVADRVFEQLRTTFRNVSPDPDIRLLHHRVTTYFDAVFSPCASLFSDRPVQMTPFSNLALAGDWTQTFWPATMEGAVRSGRLAVEALGEIR